MLELRLNQIENIDKSLEKKINYLLNDLPTSPEDCLEGVRKVVDIRLKIIFDSILGEKNKIHQPTSIY